MFLPVSSLLEARVPVKRNRTPVQKTDRPPLTGSQRPSHARSLHICVCENRNRSSLHTLRLLRGPYMLLGEQMILAHFLEKSSPDRAPGRFVDYVFVPKHPKADVLLTTVLGWLRWLPAGSSARSPQRRPAAARRVRRGAPPPPPRGGWFDGERASTGARRSAATGSAAPQPCTVGQGGGGPRNGICARKRCRTAATSPCRGVVIGSNARMIGSHVPR